jgi:PhnB protein
MTSAHIYLNFMGNTEEAFNFYKSVLGGDFKALQRFSDTGYGNQLPAEEQHKIMHISLPVGNGAILMGTDTLESMGQTLKQGDNFSISLDTGSEEEATKLFNGLSEGGQITMALEKTFWNAYFGMFTDKFGVQWMVNYDYMEAD